MNGRVQDPVVGRFLSADPFVQAPYFSESLNRYSYTFNSPLSYTDPSGFRTKPKTYRVEPGNKDAVANVLRFVCSVCVSIVELMSAGDAANPGYSGLMNGLPGSLRFGAGDAGAIGREFSGGAGGGGATFSRPATAVGQPDVGDFTIGQADPRIDGQGGLFSLGTISKHLDEHVRIGWIVSFSFHKIVGVTVDLGSARLGDKTGERWTERGKVATYSEGRAQFRLDTIFGGAIAEERWEGNRIVDPATVTTQSGILLDYLRGSDITIDLSIGVFAVYENSFTIRYVGPAEFNGHYYEDANGFEIK